MTVAVYPGTFDPVHHGHIDVALRAANLFDKLIVGVYDRPQKQLMFSADERVEMLRRSLDGVANITVQRYRGLTVDFVREVGASCIVRGLRVISDFELEYQMALTTRKLAPEVDMVCLMTSLDFAFISSTIVKDIAFSGSSVGQFVPAHVDDAIRQRVAES